MKRKKRLGQSIVEFALVIPLFMLVVTFILDMGRIVYLYSGMTHAVREGARYGSAYGINCNYADVNDKVQEMVTFPIAPITDCSAVDEDGYKVVYVFAEHDFVAATPFIENLFLNGQIVIHAESTMHLEFAGE